jgi:hypothetical protein
MVVDALEPRMLLSNYVVTNPNDNGNNAAPLSKSLRWAINKANLDPGSTINIDFSQVQPYQPLITIHLLSQLPAITAGHTQLVGPQPSVQRVAIDGSAAGSGATGLRLSSNNDFVTLLDIVNFGGAGIVDQGNTNFILDCNIGTHSDDLPGSGNGEGIDVLGAAGAHLMDDVIKDSTFNGIKVVNSGGVLINGGESEANGRDGLIITGTGPNAGTGYTTRVFSVIFDENGWNGVHILNSSKNNIGVSGDPATLGSDGESAALTELEPSDGNMGDGALIESSPGQVSTGNVIGFNHIAGNNGNGVELTGAGTTGNSLVDNEIGVTVTKHDTGYGPLVVGNMLDGVRIGGGANLNVIGGHGLMKDGVASNGQGNLIINNQGAGIRITDPGTNQNIVESNVIGPAIDMSLGNFPGAGPNAGGGVVITNGASSNLIGGLAAVAVQSGLGNLISGNAQFGVDISGAGVTHNVLAGNWIGTDETGEKPESNAGPGVIIEAGATNNSVGLYAPLVGRFGNVISGNREGVVIRDAGTMDNSVHGNNIGTDVPGISELSNGGDGVQVSGGASVNFVGGLSTAIFTGVPDNLISGNGGDGVQLQGVGTTFNLVAGNFIGSDATGDLPVPNVGNGVDMANGAVGNIVGGGLPALGNVIAANTGVGVVVDAASSGELIQFNRIGTSWDGTNINGNLGSGVVLEGSGIRVANNQISGNNANGVEIDGSLDWLYGNNIGANAVGSAALGNTFNGVVVDVTQGTGSNTIGGPVPGLGNQISGNGGNGIYVTGASTANNTIDGNVIGTNATGTAMVPNASDGILIVNSSGYVIGGSAPATRNIISGNTQDGVLLNGSGTSGISVIGNTIGSDATGQKPLGNGANGVAIIGASNNTIGGATAALGNLISGNVNDGVLIRAIPESPSGPSPATGNMVLGNKIGTDALGQFKIANGNNGVELEVATINYIGGSATGDGNLISGNGADGVLIQSHSNGNHVQGNSIGTVLGGNQALANGHNGVRVVVSTNNLIGGIGAGTGNLISGNTEDGVMLASLANGNFVQSNRIGTTADGAVALPNGGNGVTIAAGSNNNLIGGVDALGDSGGNVISGNTLSGIWITSGSSQNQVQRNFIGTDANGAKPVGNSQSGVSITNGATGNVIGGGPVSGKNGIVLVGNRISGNALDGVTISDLTTNGNLVQGDQIGTYASNLANQGNGRDGVFIHEGAQLNVVGGSIADANTIAYNTAAGVAIGGNASDQFTLGNRVTYNSIFSDGTIGIDLGSDGPTPNTTPSPHIGPNALQSTPELKLLSATATSTTVRIFLNTTPGATINIQLFASSGPNASGHVEGETFLVDVPVQIDAGGNINNGGNGYVDVTISQNLLGQYLTATATDTNSLNTSEFSPAISL